MSRETLFDRTIVVRHVAEADENARGNPTRAVVEVPEVPAYRFQVSANEDTKDRDAQARTFVYLLPVFLDDGTELALTGRDELVDDGAVLKVLGTPIVATSRGRPRHVEARAYFVA